MKSASSPHLNEILASVLHKKLARPEEAASISQDMVKVLADIVVRQPCQILLTGFNVPDGLGDFVNLIHYYSWMKETFHGITNIHIKAVAIVSHAKINRIGLVLPEGLLANNYYVFKTNSPFDEEKARNCELLIINCNDNAKDYPSKIAQNELDDLFKTNAYLKSLFSKADFLLNISTALESTHNIFLSHITARCWVRSILEYGPPTSIEKFPKNRMVYVEKSMGFHSDDFGIKFNENIWRLRFNNNDEKAIGLLALRNRALCEFLLNFKQAEEGGISISDAKNYFTACHLGIAYLQDEKDKTTGNFINKLVHTHNFVLLLCATTEKKYIDVIVNIDAFITNNASQKAAFLPSELAVELRNLGIARIHICNTNGERIVEPLNINPTGTRTLRIISYSGQHSSDIERLLVLADICGGSGDNSISDVIAARTFPFFGIFNHKAVTMRELIKLIARTEIKNKELLMLYLEIQIRVAVGTQIVNYNIQELCECARQNYPLIKGAWEELCLHIYSKHNAKSSFYELAMGFVLNKMLDEPRDLESCKKYSSHLQINRQMVISSEHFIHMAIIKGNLEMVRFLISIHENIESRTDKFNLSCLHLAAYLGRDDIAIELLRASPKIDVVSQQVHGILSLAVQNLSPETVRNILLLDNKIRFKDTEERDLIINYLKSHVDLLEIAINQGHFMRYNRNLLLFWSVVKNDIGLMSKFLESGAQIEIDKNLINHWDGSSETNNTCLHILLQSGDKPTILNFLNRYQFYIYDVKNQEGQLAEDLTEDEEIKHELDKKSCRSRLAEIIKLNYKSVAIVDDDLYQENYIAVELNDFEDAWMFWKFLYDRKIICDRPDDECKVLLPRIIFEKILINVNFKIDELPNPNSIVLRIINELNLLDALKKNFGFKVTIQPHGTNGVEIFCENLEIAQALLGKLRDFSIRCKLSEKDLCIEITHITQQIHLLPFELICNYRLIGKKLCSVINVGELEFNFNEENNIILLFKSPEEAHTALKVLTNFNIFCDRRDADNSFLTLSADHLLCVYQGKVIEPPRPSPLLQAIHPADIEKVIHKEIGEVPQSINSFGDKGIVILFKNGNDAKSFYKKLEEKYLDAYLCLTDNSIQITSGLKYFNDYIKSLSTDNLAKSQASKFIKHV